MYLIEINYNRFVVYTDDGKLVIQTSDSGIAKRICNGEDNSKRDRPTENTTSAGLSLSDSFNLESLSLAYDAR